MVAILHRWKSILSLLTSSSERTASMMYVLVWRKWEENHNNKWINHSDSASRCNIIWKCSSWIAPIRLYCGWLRQLCTGDTSQRKKIDSVSWVRSWAAAGWLRENFIRTESAQIINGEYSIFSSINIKNHNHFPTEAVLRYVRVNYSKCGAANAIDQRSAKQTRMKMQSYHCQCLSQYYILCFRHGQDSARAP